MRSSAWRISVIWKSGYGEILFPEATLPRSLRCSGRHRANSVLPADSAVTPGYAESSSKTLILCNFAQFPWRLPAQSRTAELRKVHGRQLYKRAGKPNHGAHGKIRRSSRPSCADVEVKQLPEFFTYTPGMQCSTPDAAASRCSMSVQLQSFHRA